MILNDIKGQFPSPSSPEELEQDVIKKLLELENITKKDTAPFPYDDTQKLRELTGSELEDLNPDLNTYFMDVTGLSSWGRKALTWPTEELDKIEKVMEKGFYDKHPEYKFLEEIINRSALPGLKEQLEMCDHLRAEMLSVLKDLRNLKSKE